MTWRSVLGLAVSAFLLVGLLCWILAMPAPARLVGAAWPAAIDSTTGVANG
ncbi:hypothetical protein [Herbiconiux liangxiaofengii]|uniref:hypothetical protein n=1 Tax=Herbiconiux liangxiaofengii TaxID=3342795 RepID=UPI0035B96B58